MLFIRGLVLILAWHVGSYAEFSFSKNANNYGPYTIIWKKYETCQGPKSKNLTTMIAQLYNNETNSLITYNTTFHTAARLTEIKVHVYHVNGAQKTTLWNHKIDKPCQHFAVASILAKYMPLQNNCIVNKGELYFVLDFTEVATRFFGTSFFYGVFTYKVVILANQGNVMCVVMTMEFIKKK